MTEDGRLTSLRRHRPHNVAEENIWGAGFLKKSHTAREACACLVLGTCPPRNDQYGCAPGPLLPLLSNLPESQHGPVRDAARSLLASERHA